MKTPQFFLGIFLALLAVDATTASEMEGKMSTIQGPIPISDLRAFKAPPILSGGPETLGGRQAKTLDMPTPAERTAQIAEQRAVKAHTVYKVNGEVIAMHQRNGWSTSTNAGAGIRNIPGQGDAEEVGRARGLTGDALNEFVADQITANLKEKYGSALEVETYSNAATAPTSGEIRDQMAGIDSQSGSLRSQTSRITMDSEHWAQLLEAYR